MIHISNRLIELRKKHHLTQSDVANHLGVTKASVSKWETGQTLPDIALLPLIASYYGVTLDELMDYQPELTGQQIQSRYEAYTGDLAEKEFPLVFAQLKEDIRRYYSCYPFLLSAAMLLLNHCPPASTGLISPELFQEVHALMETLCRRVEENSHDKFLQENAYSIRIYLKLQQGHFQQVIDELSDLMHPDHIGDMESLLITAYTANGQLQEADITAQISIYRGILTLLQNMLHRMQLQAGDPTALLESSKRAEAVIDAFDILHLHPNTAAGFYYQTAILWMAIGKGELDKELETRVIHYLDLFSQASLHLFQDDLQIHGDDYFPCITNWFAGNRMGPVPVRNKKEVYQSVMEGFDHPLLQGLDQDIITSMKEKFRKDCQAYL